MSWRSEEDDGRKEKRGEGWGGDWEEERGDRGAFVEASVKWGGWDGEDDEGYGRHSRVCQWTTTGQGTTVAGTAWTGTGTGTGTALQ